MPRIHLVIICFAVGLLIGVALILIERYAIERKSYICGEAPSSEEIEDRGAPVCLTTNVRERPLCLMPDLDPNKPSTWCQEDINSQEEESQSFYLYWLPCATCGPAWRMFWEMNN